MSKQALFKVGNHAQSAKPYLSNYSYFQVYIPIVTSAGLGSSWLRGQDVDLAAGPNKIERLRLHSSINALGPSRKPRPNQVPTPRTKSIHIQQPAQVTPVRRPRGESRETLTARRCSRNTAQGSWTTDLCAWNLALGPWFRVKTKLQVRF